MALIPCAVADPRFRHPATRYLPEPYNRINYNLQNYPEFNHYINLPTGTSRTDAYAIWKLIISPRQIQNNLTLCGAQGRLLANNLPSILVIFRARIAKTQQTSDEQDPKFTTTFQEIR
jgi:hypothetical protein